MRNRRGRTVLALLFSGLGLTVLAPGKLADIVVLRGDPLEDFSSVSRVAAVVLGGQVLNRESSLATRPERTGEWMPGFTKSFLTVC